MDFTKQITTYEEAKSFIKELFDNDMHFHFEDAPSTIIKADGTNLFTAEEAKNVESRMDEFYDKWEESEFECPIGYLLHLMEHKEIV